MIFYWLRNFWRWVKWLFVPPAKRDVARVHADMRCPCCGNTRGSTIRCVEMVNKERRTQIFCEHTCGECGGRWFELPVGSTNPEYIWPALPRTEIEKQEDANLVLQRAELNREVGTGVN